MSNKEVSRAKQEKDKWTSAVDALNRLTTAAGANIEALANNKLHATNELKSETNTILNAANETYTASEQEWAKKIEELAHLSEAQRVFFFTVPRVSTMPPPEVDEYSLLSKDMPALSLFVHRGIGAMRELNETVAERNETLSEFHRENGEGGGMSGVRLRHFLEQLAGQGRVICEETDYALDYWRLVLEQVKKYMTKKARGEVFLEHKLIDEVKGAMPTSELFPDLRKQLVTFDD